MRLRHKRLPGVCPSLANENHSPTGYTPEVFSTGQTKREMQGMHFFVVFVNVMSSQAHRWKLCLLSPAFKWNAQIKNLIKSTRAQTLVRLTVCRWKEPNADLLLLHVFSLTPVHTSGGLHLFILSFFPPAADSFFLPWAAAAVFWALSLGAFCAAADAELEDFEGCVGFEVALEGFRRRRPSSPAEDEWHLLLPPSSPIGG